MKIKTLKECEGLLKTLLIKSKKVGSVGDIKLGKSIKNDTLQGYEIGWSSKLKKDDYFVSLIDWFDGDYVCTMRLDSHFKKGPIFMPRVKKLKKVNDYEKLYSNLKKQFDDYLKHKRHNVKRCKYCRECYEVTLKETKKIKNKELREDLTELWKTLWVNNCQDFDIIANEFWIGKR